MLKEVVDFYKWVPNYTPTCFGKWLPSSGCLLSYSSNALRLGVAYTDHDPSRVATRDGS
jgi:hypothetical protein